jgi:glyoxylase-like metal-dependent hydrolase (beta-lactamase superfamily II)
MEFGDHRVEVIPDTEFSLDGGAMFGVVPRVVWERVCPPDELNRVRLNCNCLFIDTGKQKVLVETGMGEKWTRKQMSMYGIRRERPFADSLRQIAGCGPEDIDIVINTHLHFDHAGGNTVMEDQLTDQRKDRSGSAAIAPTTPHSHRPQFPNARYMVSRSEFMHAGSPHERDRASYLDENWHPLVESRQLELMPDTYEAVPGLVLEQVRGHSETMQTVKLTSRGETLFGFFDLLPTRHHLPVPWIMAYDLYPTETMEFKRRILPQALEEKWLCHFYHDVDAPLCRLIEINGKLAAVPV